MFLERSLTVCLCICQSNWPTSSWGFSCLYPPHHQRTAGRTDARDHIQHGQELWGFKFRPSSLGGKGSSPWSKWRAWKGFWFCRERGAESRWSQQPHVSVITEFRSSCEGFLGEARTLLVLGILIRAQRDNAMTTATGASTGPGGCMFRSEAPALEALFLRSSFPNNRSVLLPGFLLWFLAHFLYIFNGKKWPPGILKGDTLNSSSLTLISFGLLLILRSRVERTLRWIRLGLLSPRSCPTLIKLHNCPLP